ncbi:MAG TPA: alpha/beta-hydrolase N-terminal domain-containing protein, partial [Streptosporangiaceae bacterium]|nr:alpha/beta-hydrolase N-terminal domain-containing protein [Streptosporangiaceae bacterium]
RGNPVAAAFGLGQYWQYEIRKLTGVTEYNLPLVVASPFVAALVFGLLLAIGRGLRGLYRWLAQQLRRWMRPRAARGIGVAAVAVLTCLGSADCCCRVSSTL